MIEIDTADINKISKSSMTTDEDLLQLAGHYSYKHASHEKNDKLIINGKNFFY